MPSTFAPSPAIVAESALRRQVATQSGELRVAKESIAKLQIAIEDRNWRRIGNANSAVTGLNLDDIRAVSEDLRGWIVAGGIIKRIIELRGFYIYGDGVAFKNLGAAEDAFTKNENNIAKLFSIPALQEVNRAHGSEGTIVFLVHKKTREIIRLPFAQLNDPFIDTEDAERIWYVRRTYKRITVDAPLGVDFDRYYRTSTLPASEVAKKRVKIGRDEFIDVDPDYTAVAWKVNGQIGWPFGIPDLLPSLQWAEKWTGYLKNQDRFAEALALIAWEYKSATADQAKKVAANVATMGDTVAGTNVSTSDTEMKALPGNSGVTFTNGEPLAAQAAAAGEVPVESVLAKSQVTAGGKLDPDVARMAMARRASATEFFKALGRLLGAPDLEVLWPDLESETPFREAEMMIAAWGTGMFAPEEIRDPLAQKLLITLEDGKKAPEGVLIPNNADSLEATAKANASATPEPNDDNDFQNGQGKDALGVGTLSDGDNEARDRGEV